MTHRLDNDDGIMSHLEVSESESGPDRQDLNGLLLSGRRPLFRPIQTNLSSVLEIFALCQSKIFNVRPTKSKYQNNINKLMSNRQFARRPWTVLN